MKDTLHVLSIRHDSSIKSLTKQALAQIIVKIIYSEKSSGVNLKRIQHELTNKTSVRFNQEDILVSLRLLINSEKKVYQKNDNYLLQSDYRLQLEKELIETEKNFEEIVKFWFSDTETYKCESGESSLKSWFESTLIDFFNDYSYDWIRDLLPNRKESTKKSPSVDKLIKTNLSKSKILADDYDWVRKKFIEFIESTRHIDNELLWLYGSSRFSATLLTARNFADEFSLDAFKDSTFILDTNILMILELEAFEHNEAIKVLEDFFINYNVKPQYFNISREEYKRVILPKKDSVLLSFDKYQFDVFSKIDCVFIKTALQRGAVEREDFERFFNQIIDVPDKFFNELKLECRDDIELDKAILSGEKDEKLLEKLNKLYKQRTGNDKRTKPNEHDAGLYSGAIYLKQSEKVVILTRDSVLRDFSAENVVRDECPLAIGLDSIIQMLALNSGGTSNTATNFAPLFSKIVSSSLFPEKEMFKTEDLEFILKYQIEINDLESDNIIEIAKKVNKLRYSSVEDTEIALEIRRLFQSGIGDLKGEILTVKDESQRIQKENNIKDKSILGLNQNLIEEKMTNLYNSAKAERRKKIILTIIILALVFVLSYYLVKLLEIEKKNSWIEYCIQICSVLLGVFIPLLGFRIKFKIKRESYREESEEYVKSLNL